MNGEAVGLHLGGWNNAPDRDAASRLAELEGNPATHTRSEPCEPLHQPSTSVADSFECIVRNITTGGRALFLGHPAVRSLLAAND